MPSCSSTPRGLPLRALRFGAILAALFVASVAQAGLVTSTVDMVGVDLPPNARVPTSLAMVDETGASRTLAQAIDGRPAVLILGGHTCRALRRPVPALVRGCPVPPG